MIAVDINVLSELTRPQPSTAVVEWLRRNARLIAIPTVVIGELRYGVQRLPEGKRKRSLSQALDALIDRFAATLLPYDLTAANACGDILAAAEALGRPMNLADAQIAGTARAARAALATRNIGDFAAAKLTLIDPWQS